LREYETIDEVLNAETQYPLQQFFLTPWYWKFLAQHRREVPSGRSRFAGLYRVYWFLSIDLGLHLMILSALRLVGRFRFLRFLYRKVIPRTVLQNRKVIDDSAKMLVMEHELFRHMEMELFVTRENLPAAVEYLRDVLILAGGSATEQSALTENGLDLDRAESELLATLRDQYCHHYPICIRRVMVDETLISMASGGSSDWYAISLISYAKPARRQSFLNTMNFLAATMSRKFGARPHWGKYCPLPAQDLIRLYPHFSTFRDICTGRDPHGVFRNRWMQELFAAKES
jgi:hypothetical protein